VGFLSVFANLLSNSVKTKQIASLSALIPTFAQTIKPELKPCDQMIGSIELKVTEQ